METLATSILRRVAWDLGLYTNLLPAVLQAVKQHRGKEIIRAQNRLSWIVGITLRINNEQGGVRAQ